MFARNRSAAHTKQMRARVNKWRIVTVWNKAKFNGNEIWKSASIRIFTKRFPDFKTWLEANAHQLFVHNLYRLVSHAPPNKLIMKRENKISGNRSTSQPLKDKHKNVITEKGNKLKIEKCNQSEWSKNTALFLRNIFWIESSMSKMHRNVHEKTIEQEKISKKEWDHRQR